MSEETSPGAAAAAAATPPPAAPDPAKRELAVQVLTELFRLMDLPARVEAKDGGDGGISVAMQLDGDFPGLQAGRRTHVVDAVQFIANKLVNKAGTTKRWISIGVGAHPEPRAPGERARKPAPQPGAPKAAVAPAARPAPAAARPPPAPRAPAEADEASLQVPEDPALAALGKALAEKSSALGRFYAVAPMKAEDRARLLRGAKEVSGLRVFVEGEGRNRRLVFAPDKPAPMPKRSALPQDDDELED